MATKISNKITHPQKSSGFFLVLAPFLLLALMGFSTLVVDVGMMRVTNSQLQTVTDSAALSAANALSNGNSAATAAAIDIANRNEIIGHGTASNIQVQLGAWDTNSGTFTATNISPTAVRVTANATPPLFFTKLFSSNNYTVSAQSTAALIGGPRDIIFIVDLSPWMNFYSQLSSYPQQSISTIIANLQSVYNAMNLPQLGNMTWAPRNLAGSNNAIILALGLQNVAYPFPSGSWSNYVSYIKSDAAINATGYRNQYGYLTFVNYLLTQQPQFDQTPTLWKTPEQPLQSVKTSLTAFLSQSVTGSDRTGLVTYNRNNGNTATLEQSLTVNFSTLSTILNGNPKTNTPGRQAAHYSTNSNMLSAVSAAIDELNNNGRPDAQWVIYILSAGQISNTGEDGNENNGGNWQSILNAAKTAKKDKITINAITFSLFSNAAMIQQVAQITGGTSTSVPPSSTDFSQTLGNMANSNGTAQIVK